MSENNYTLTNEQQEYFEEMLCDEIPDVGLALDAVLKDYDIKIGLLFDIRQKIKDAQEVVPDGFDKSFVKNFCEILA